MSLKCHIILVSYKPKFLGKNIGCLDGRERSVGLFMLNIEEYSHVITEPIKVRIHLADWPAEWLELSRGFNLQTLFLVIRRRRPTSSTSPSTFTRISRLQISMDCILEEQSPTSQSINSKFFDLHRFACSQGLNFSVLRTKRIPKLVSDLSL